MSAPDKTKDAEFDALVDEFLELRDFFLSEEMDDMLPEPSGC